MKKHIFVFLVIACTIFVYTQNVFAYQNVNQGCTICHTQDAVHAGEKHEACTTCHTSPSGGPNVAPAKCAVCHPRVKPGACNLVKLSAHSSQNCSACHSDCKSNCPAAEVLGDDDPRLVTLRGFRDKILAKSALGKRIISMYYNNADSIQCCS